MNVRSIQALLSFSKTSSKTNRQRALLAWSANRRATFAVFCVMCTWAFSIRAWAQDPRVKEAVKKIDEIAARGPFRPTWDSLVTYKVPEWYQDAKFGIFIHWGVYSVPAFDSEWYPRNMYIAAQPAFKHHVDMATDDIDHRRDG